MYDLVYVNDGFVFFKQTNKKPTNITGKISWFIIVTINHKHSRQF